ncbi:MAG TPA: hypothetical protein DIU14_08625 [Actinobacteria bacterium]|nr:hypothetical protein [Actinomycetota bacterium]
MRCSSPAEAGVWVRRSAHEVLVGALAGPRDPRVLGLCTTHLERLVPPQGCRVRDVRPAVAISSSGARAS